MKLMLSYDQVAGFLASYGFTLHNIAPLIVIASLLYIAIKKTIGSDITNIGSRVKNMEHSMIEIQTMFKTKYPKLTLQHTISKYGEANSPIVLKPEFKTFITEPNLDKQIENKKSEPVEWLKKQKPKTGLDAQDDIGNFVTSDEVSKYLNLTEYKQNLYKKGKTSQDAIGILAIYLFEALIPKLQIPDGDKKENKK